MRMRHLCAALLALPLVGCFGTSSSTTFKVEKPDISFEVPPFNLTERSGKKVNRDDLKGKVWVASFVFTRCMGPCPQVTGTMARLQKELNLADQSDLVFVTFTVDPDRDTPNDLKDYANKFQANPEKWLFLTGPEATIHSLLKDGFKVSAQRKKEATPGDEFDHSTRLAVIDREGNIRAYYDGIRLTESLDPEGDFEKNIQDIKEKVGTLLKAK
jgi:protein SCO1/2